jgi:centromeric protein E
MTGSGEFDEGIIQLAIRDLFNRLSAAPDCEFLVRVSFCEIYNETLKDLLEPGNVKLNIYGA